MSSTWRIDLRVHGARPDGADGILAALDDAWDEIGVDGSAHEDAGEAEIACSGIEQIPAGGSFEARAAELAAILWEANGAYADVEAAGTRTDDLEQGTWASSEDDYEAWMRGQRVPAVAVEPGALGGPAGGSGMAAAIVICRSMGDGDATAYGPFAAASFDEAVAAAKAWLRTQPCRPARRDPFWTSPRELACERLLRGEDGPAGHEIVWLEAP